MPFRAAHWLILTLLGLTVVAFWPTYFGVFRAAPVEFHVHGMTATLWLLLLGVQSWAIQNRHTVLHRRFGLASIALFPLFAASGLLVIQTMARTTIAGADPFYVRFGPPLAAYDLLATAGAMGFYFQALRGRRNVPLHAGYMLGTALFLVGPIMVRLFGMFVPWLMIDGPGSFYLFNVQLHLANVLTVAVCLVLARLRSKSARPFLAAIAITVLESLAFELIGPSQPWGATVAWMAELPTSGLFGFSVAGASALAFSGWALGSSVKRAPVPAVA